MPWRLLLNGQREGREEKKSLERRGREGRALHVNREGVVKERVKDIETLSSAQEVWPLRDYIKRSEGRRGRDKLGD